MSGILATGSIANAVATTNPVINAPANLVIDAIYFLPYSITSTVAGGAVVSFVEDTTGQLIFEVITSNPNVGSFSTTAPIIMPFAKGLVIPRGRGLQIRTVFSGASNYGALYGFYGSLVT